ncbi:type II secretion system F family protein [Ruminococcus albus]|uniref:Type II secretion system F domain n=1 Tax=Ruminococcus albus (strain ATCC 27210 / DSM 20455 / JCM 14654 / NCDO 2250 / 7) TaxID=697329 RepID=E6UJB4_RUMA7|nr:type II secretion system F family protein [Ruminococcus albus]ADU23760.1 Type II secretion system F domain [Ruminococcus albus 7 = DSM 20455]
MYYAIFFAGLSVILIFLAVIINVREKKNIINKKDADFIDIFIEKKKQYLASIPGAMSIKTYLILMLFFPLTGSVGAWFLSKELWLSIIIFFVGLFIPKFIVSYTEKKHKKNFEERYARALRQLSSSLRAGMTLQQAVEDLCKCPFIHYEIKKEFRQINSDIQLGFSISEAFGHMAERIPTADVKDVVSAIKMQSLVGGSEAESIEIITNNINSRMMLRKEIKTLFASTKMTIIGMDILPAIIILFLYYSSPMYFRPLFSTLIGRLVFVLAIILMVIGSYIDRKFLNRVKGVD